MKRFAALTAAAIAACLGTASFQAQAAEHTSAQAAAHARNRPNIVYVLTDDLAGNLTPYMKQVQAMKREGTSFTNYFVTDSLCCPSRTTGFTGEFPHNTGVFTNAGADGGYGAFNAHGNQNHTFATALRAAGYRTGMMGKYLNGYEPTKDPVPPGWSEWDVAGQGGYHETNYKLNENGKPVYYGGKPRDYLTDVLNRKGQKFIERSAKAGKPFMLELATFAPHTYKGLAVPAPRDKKKYLSLKAPVGRAFNEADMSDKPAWIKNYPKLTKKDINKIDTAYRKRVQAVQAVDKMLGDIRAALRKYNVARNTYVIFGSDNGYHMGEHRLMPGKMTAYDTDINVPFVVTGPGVKANHVSTEIAQNTDLCPTFEDLGGVKIPATVDGRSLKPFFSAGKQPAPREAALIEHHGPDGKAAGPDLPPKNSGNPPSYEAVRTATDLYVEYTDGEREYYNLRNDPNELNNTIKHVPATRLKHLKATLHRLEKCTGSTGSKSCTPK